MGKKLLITGAFKYTDAMYKEFTENGFDIIEGEFDERIPLPEGSPAFEAEYVICNSLFTKNDIKLFRSLRSIQLTSAGLDRVPLDYIKENGIKLFSARGVYSIPMAEWAVLKALEIYKSSFGFRRSQQERKWEKNRNLRELYGKTVCIVGCGSVGTETAKRFSAFGTYIIGADIFPCTSPLYNEFADSSDVKTLNQALCRSDIVVLTLPLTEQTRGFIGKEQFEAMKTDSVIINIARGAVIDENALIDALNDNEIGYAALDVFESEPLASDSALWKMDNVMVTPHNSFVSDNIQSRLYSLIKQNLFED